MPPTPLPRTIIYSHYHFSRAKDIYLDIIWTKKAYLSFFCVMQIPPIAAVSGGFGSAQRISQDFPECNENSHSVKDILGKNILQFGFVLSELMKNCRNSEDFEEV